MPPDMFKFVQLELRSVQGPPPPDIFKVVRCEARTVGKRVVGIRL